MGFLWDFFEKILKTGEYPAYYLFVKGNRIEASAQATEKLFFSCIFEKLLGRGHHTQILASWGMNNAVC